MILSAFGMTNELLDIVRKVEKVFGLLVSVHEQLN